MMHFKILVKILYDGVMADQAPIYRGGGLQSRCNGRPGFGGYKIVGVCLNLSRLLRAPRFAGKGCVASNVAKRSI